MPAPRFSVRVPLLPVCMLSACMVFALAACAMAAGEPEAGAHATPVSADAVYPPDVYRPADYRVRSVADSGAVRTITGDASVSVPALVAQARAAMPMQGWQETRARQSPSAHTLAFEKSGYRAELTLQAYGTASHLQLQLHRP